MKKAIFLDRDGVINKNVAEHDYVKSWEEFTLLDGVIDSLKFFHKLGYITVVVTNQPGVSKGLMTEKTLLDIHRRLNNLLAEHNEKIDYFYYCTHTDQEKCDCRKPKTGMVVNAVKDLDIDLKRSILIGDRDSDSKLGENAGVKTIRVKTNSNLYKNIMKKKNAIYFKESNSGKGKK